MIEKPPNWRTQETAFALTGEHVLTATMPWGRSEVIVSAEAVVSVSLHAGHAAVSVAAET